MRLNFLSWIVLLCPALAINAQLTETKPVVKEMSLDDCIRMALERNLTIQVGDRIALGDEVDLDLRSGGKLGLELARINLHQAYSAYEPVLSGRVGQTHSIQPGGIDPVTGFTFPGSDQWTEQYRVGIAGNLPSGANYELFGSVSRSSPTETTFFQYRSSLGVSLTQPLLRDAWIDSARLNIKLRKRDLKITELTFKLLVMDIIQKVATAYYDLAAALDQIKVQEKALELANQLVAENKKKVQVGTLAPLDERQAESQAATAKAALTEAIYNAQAAENSLKSLITHDFGPIQSTKFEPTDKLLAVFQAFTLAESWRTGLENRPDYLESKEQLERNRIVLKYHRNQLFPALDVTGTYQRNGLGGTTSDSLETIDNNRFPTYSGFLTLTVPLGFRRERDNYKQGKIAIQASVIELKRKEDQVLREIDDALKLVKSTYEKTESTRQARIFAEEALDAEQKKLENGKSTSFQVLQFQRDLTQARSDEISALTEYNKALHLLYFREGTTLERNKINLDLK